MAGDFGVDVPVDLHDVGPAVIVVIDEAASPSNVASIDSEARGKANVTEAAIAVVVVDVDSVVGEVGLENVEPAVAIVIGDTDAHAGLLVAIFTVSTAGDNAYVGEGAVVIVVEEDAGLRINGDVNVGPAIVVEIVGDRGDGIARAGLENTGFFRGVGKRAIAVVVEENVVAPETAEKVVPAVIVVIADADAGLPAGAAEP